MNKRLLLLFCVFFSTQTYTMKRTYKKTRKARPTKKQAAIEPINYSFNKLPQDMQNVIIDFLINDTSEKKPRKAALMFNSLACVNKKFNNLINHPEHKGNPLYSDNLIESLSKNYGCSHESIAKFLHTQATIKRLELQKKLCPLFNWKSNKAIRKELNQLIKEGLNLNFTYNHQNVQKTPLMRAIHSPTNIFDLLIKKGADINTRNSHGLSALKVLLEPPINTEKLTTFLGLKNLDLNQQDTRGKTPLFYMLVNSKRLDIGFTNVFRTTLQIFLENNVDPELGTKSGLTPLEAAQYWYLNYPEVAIIIQDAIDRKKAKQLTLQHYD